MLPCHSSLSMVRAMLLNCGPARPLLAGMHVRCTAAMLQVVPVSPGGEQPQTDKETSKQSPPQIPPLKAEHCTAGQASRP